MCWLAHVGKSTTGNTKKGHTRRIGARRMSISDQRSHCRFADLSSTTFTHSTFYTLTPELCRESKIVIVSCPILCFLIKTTKRSPPSHNTTQPTTTIQAQKQTRKHKFENTTHALTAIFTQICILKLSHHTTPHCML